MCNSKFRETFPIVMQEFNRLLANQTQSSSVEYDLINLFTPFGGLENWLKNLRVWCDETIILGRFGFAIRNLIIELNIKRLPQFFPNLDENTSPFVTICKLLCALECWRDSLYYCEYGLLQNGSAVDLSALRRICIENLLPEKPNFYISDDYEKLPHVKDADWLNRILQSDDLLFSSQMIYEKRTADLVLIEKKIAEEKISISLKNFNSQHLDHIKPFNGNVINKPKAVSKTLANQNNPTIANKVQESEKLSVKSKTESKSQQQTGKKKNPRNLKTKQSSKSECSVLDCNESKVDEFESKSNFVDDSRSTSSATAVVADNTKLRKQRTMPQNETYKNNTNTTITIDKIYSKLKEMFHFELACKSCIENENVRCEDSYIIVRKNHKRCKLDIILARNLNKKGNFLVKVRFDKVNIAEEFSICSSLKQNKHCELKDICPKAHSSEEQNIWNIVNNSGIDFKRVYELIKTSLSATNASESPKNESVGSKKLNIAKKPFSIVPNLILPNNNVHSSSNEAIDLTSTIPLFETYDFYPCCKSCLTNALSQHNCDRSVLLCRQKKDFYTNWHEVRSKPVDLRTNVTYFTLCRDYPTCARSRRCTFAHNELERILWTREIRKDQLTMLLANAIVIDTRGKIEFPNIGVISFRLACPKCAITLVPHYYILYFYKHKCLENMIMFKEVSSKVSDIWYRISPKPATYCNGNFQMCIDCKGASCTYAHSKLECHFWRLEFENRFVLSDYLEKQKTFIREPPICCILVSSGNNDEYLQQLKTLADVQKFTSSYSVQNSPTKLRKYTKEDFPELSKQPLVEVGGSEVITEKPIVNPKQSNSSLFKKIDVQELLKIAAEETIVPCKFRVHYICGRCHKESKVVYQGLNGQCNNTQKHVWKDNRTLVIFNDNNLVETLRPVPEYLRNAYAIHPVNVQMCNLKPCRLWSCSFAHNETERKCWMYLLRTGKDVDDIVQENSSSTNDVSIASTVRSNLPKSCPWAPVKHTPSDDLGVSILTLENRACAFYCYLCDKNYGSEVSFEKHCSNESHQRRLLVDQTRGWTCRAPKSPPPFKICQKLNDILSCPFGNSCVDAHTKDELDEWFERMKFIRYEMERQTNDDLNKILDIIYKAKAKSDIVVDAVKYADIDFHNCDPLVEFSNEKKGEPFRWTFAIATEKPLIRVILLDKRYFYYFRIMSSEAGGNVICGGEHFKDIEYDNYYEVRLEFIGSKSLGTFTQEILFDFGGPPFVSRNVTVHVGVNKVTLTRMARLEQLLTAKDCWNVDNCEVIWISKERFDHKTSTKDVVANLHFELNESTYFTVMEKWILAEEMRRQMILSSFRLSSTATVLTELYNDRDQPVLPRKEGSYFVRVDLDNPLSEDFDIIELLRDYCQYAFVALPDDKLLPLKAANAKRRVYEADLVGRHNFCFEGVDQQSIHLCLSAVFVRHFQLQPGHSIPLEIQFNIHHKQFADWLGSLKKLALSEAKHCIFPDLLNTFSNYLLGKIDEDISRSFLKLKQLEEDWKNSGKNDEQRRVLRHVVQGALNTTHWIPPLVIFGPFGTGKTHTLAEAVAILLKESEFSKTKILICTKSNNTANMYLKLLETYTNFKSDKLKHMIYRIFPPRMRSNALPPFLRPYLRFDESSFKLERFTVETVTNVRVMIVTLSTAYRLVKFVEQHSICPSFTHIFLDEAAQGLEVETLMPLCTATKRTCIVVAGDHHQTKPTIYLEEAKELSLSYLERLYYHYDKQEAAIRATEKSRCVIPKILFNKNYRCHPDILAFVSSQFYGSETSLISCCEVPESTLKPMYFASAIGEEITSEGGISFYNDTEVFEIFAQLEYFWENWSPSWGDIDIGIITPYFDHMKIIQEKLKLNRRYLGKVHVYKIVGAQGKEFKVILLSIVRGRNLMNKQNLNSRSLGFLDDGRLINTALTRARYCVVVVGDPVILCTIGSCKFIWQNYIKYCFDNKSFLPENFTPEMLENDKRHFEASNGFDFSLMPSVHSDLFSDKNEIHFNADLIIRQLIEKTKTELSPEAIAPPSETQSDGDDVIWPEDKDNIGAITEAYFDDSVRKKRRNTASESELSEYYSAVDAKQLADEQPDDYKICILHIISSAQIYAAPIKRAEDIIHIRGRKHCKRAFHEDKVLVKVTGRVRDEERPNECKFYGKVIQIIEQRFIPEGKRFVCCADPYTIGVLSPLDVKLPRIYTLAKKGERGRFLVEWKRDSRGVKWTPVREHRVNWNNYENMLFVVLFLKWSPDYYCPLGVIVESIEPEKTFESGLKILDINYDIDYNYDCRVYRESLNLKKQFIKPADSCSIQERLPAQYRQNRKDLTKLLCFTIDHPRTKDLDDALSIENEPDKNTYKVGVHIANVTLFVPKDSPADKEAYTRCETVYSKEGAVPMFHPNLSADLLSLLPNKERAVVSVFFVIDKNGVIDETATEIHESTICCRHRLTYELAERILTEGVRNDDIPQLHDLVDRLKNLYRLALKLKECRVGLFRSLMIEHDHMQYFKAETLVSEWMITANKTVAEKVCSYDKYRELCPLRRQLSPPAKLLQQWREKFTSRAKNSLIFRHLFDENDENEDDNGDMYFPEVTILNTTLETMFRARRANDHETICKFVCTENVHPSIVPLTVEMQKMQERSFYQPAGLSDGDTRHYGMNLNLYTHFTSPIRRYMDIVVHRLLLSAVNDTPCPYDLNELDAICQHCTEKSLRAADRERDEYSLKLAVNVHEKPVRVMAVISRIGESDVNLEISYLEKTVRHLRTLRYNLLKLKKNPEGCADEEGVSKTLTWKKEIYNYEQGNRKKETVVVEPIELSSDSNISRVRGLDWFNLLEALTSKNVERVYSVVDDIRCFRESRPPIDVSSEMFVKSSSTIQKHSARFFVKWTTSTTLQIQLGVETRRGLLTPCVQLVQLTPTLNLCLEHERDSSLCFNNNKRESTNRYRYNSVLQYQQIWLPLLQIEAAENIIKSGGAIRINELKAKWCKTENGLITVTLEMSRDFCERRDIVFSRLSSDKISDNKILQLKNMIKLDYFCFEVPIKFSNNNDNYVWVAHCASVGVSLQKRDKSEHWTIDCTLIHSSTEIPDSIFEKTCICSVEFLRTPDPHHRMQSALLNLDGASDFAKKIILGEATPSEISNYKKSSRDLTCVVKKLKCDLNEPNEDQTNAILHSLTHSFSLIWGPPGTGKTVTAVRLASVIAQLNKECGNKYGVKTPKLLYCAPSNKAVNVVARIFVTKVHETDLRVIRMYSREIERSVFPLPLKEPIRRDAGQNIDAVIDSIALHRLVRKSSNSHSNEIREMDQKFEEINELLAQGQEVEDDIRSLTNKYVHLIRRAECEEIKNRCDIILCTCSAATQERLHLSDSDYIIPQLIIDEASMCNETESLIPIISTGCEQLTLVGDHKQLGPVVLSSQAREFGFTSSLFKKYAERDDPGLMKMLETHYRMQVQIADFPSNCFYQGRLKVGTTAQREMDRHIFWPNQTVPLAFCHCEGVERHSIVTTEDSSEMSASNQSEAEHVVRMVQQLIHRFRVNPEKIAILSQYRAQIHLISSLLPESIRSKISVLTVIRSQGDEWDYVFFTTVRTCSEAEVESNPSAAWIRKHLGSVTDERQVTVAITRAKKGFVILGNKLLLSVDKTWKALIDNYNERGLIFSAEKSFLKNSA